MPGNEGSQRVTLGTYPNAAAIKLKGGMELGRLDQKTSPNAAISRFGTANQWAAALNCFRNVLRSGSQIDVVLFCVTMSACAKGMQWQRVLSLLNGVADAELEQNVFSYNAAISACDKGGQWQRALALMAEIECVKLEPDVVSYNAGVSACGKEGLWQHALELLSEMRGRALEPTTIPTTPGSARARRAGSGSRPWRCWARCGRQAWSLTSP
ncbi:unnamed protein product [Prorocentrum cordatum]|uniref:Pentatricopeptide repeat-containing protein, chloroplastic n=1 Tax=Prorocentrum cordatum TaxID=2364126 RepID=A0ABN9XQV2_9DINO|nr:unnamed protein product [Polarella glacialis]